MYRYTKITKEDKRFILTYPKQSTSTSDSKFFFNWETKHSQERELIKF